MAQINNAPVKPQSVAGNGNASTDTLISRLQGQSAQLQISGSGSPSLVLNGRALPLPHHHLIAKNLPPSTSVEINLKEQKSGTIVELQRPGPMAQSLQLTPGQSLQLLQALSNNPSMLHDITPKDVNAKALQIRGDTLVLQVAGKTLTFKVPNAATKFREGQTVSLKLIHGESQWQAAIKSSDNHSTGSAIQGSAIRATPNASHIPSLLAFGLPKNTPLSLESGDKAALINLQRLLPQGSQHTLSGQASPTLTIDKNQLLKLQWTQSTQLIAKIPIDNNIKSKLAEIASQLPGGNSTTPLQTSPSLASSQVATATPQNTQNNLAQLSNFLSNANGKLSVQEGLKILSQLPPAASVEGNATDSRAHDTKPDPAKTNSAQDKNQATSSTTTTQATEALSETDITQLRKLVRDAVLQQTDKMAVLRQIQPLLRVLQARADSPAAAVTAIMNALNSLKTLDDGPISQYVNELGKLLAGETNTKTTGDNIALPTPQELKQLNYQIHHQYF